MANICYQYKIECGNTYIRFLRDNGSGSGYQLQKQLIKGTATYEIQYRSRTVVVRGFNNHYRLDSYTVNLSNEYSGCESFTPTLPPTVEATCHSYDWTDEQLVTLQCVLNCLNLCCGTSSSTIGPDAVDDSFVTVQNTPVNISVSTNDEPCPNSQVTTYILTDQTNVNGLISSWDTVAGTGVYTPTTGFIGSAQVQYEIYCDGAPSGQYGLISLTVTAATTLSPSLSIPVYSATGIISASGS